MPNTFFFIGRLTNPESRFQVQGEQLGGGLQLAVFWDAIVVSLGTSETFADVLFRVRSAIELTVAAYVFKTKVAMDYRLESWVEAQNVSTDGVIGRFTAPNQGVPSMAPQGSPLNRPWKRAARLSRERVAGNVTNNHALALRDYQVAAIDRSDNAFIYAHRAVEDICRAVTGLPDVTKAAWIAMTKTLQLGAGLVDPLNRASIAIRHNAATPQRQGDLAAAKANRAPTIDIAHKVISAEMHRTFPWF